MYIFLRERQWKFSWHFFETTVCYFIHWFWLWRDFKMVPCNRSMIGWRSRNQYLIGLKHHWTNINLKTLLRLSWCASSNQNHLSAHIHSTCAFSENPIKVEINASDRRIGYFGIKFWFPTQMGFQTDILSSLSHWQTIPQSSSDWLWTPLC